MDSNNRADSDNETAGRNKYLAHINHRPPTEHDVPNSQPILTDFFLVVSAHQPRFFRFPNIQFGKTKPIVRRFQVARFDSWRWLHYVEDEDSVICHVCTRAHIQ